MLCLHDPSHIPSVLDLFNSKPETSRKMLNSSNRFSAEDASETKAVVSSAYCDILYTLS